VSATNDAMMIDPRIGPSSIGTPTIAMTRPTRAGPAVRVRIVMPADDHAAAETLEDAEEDERLRRPGEAGERRADHEEGDRAHVEA
jgi:hypothetical protein